MTKHLRFPKTERQANGLLLGLFCLLMVVSTIGIHATNAMDISFYTALSTSECRYANSTWDTSYNCLAYALGYTNWEWPWGSALPTNAQVNTYLAGKGYDTVSNYPMLISYGGSSSAIGHFAKVTNHSTVTAKWGSLDLILHASWNPYKPTTFCYLWLGQCIYGYGSLQTVYYATPPPINTLEVTIDGPEYARNNQSLTFCGEVSVSNPHYVFTWGYNYTGGSTYTNCGNTSCITRTMPTYRDLYLKLTVLDPDGTTVIAYYHVFNTGSSPFLPGDKLERTQNYQNNVELMLTDLLNDDLIIKNFSANPYDYTDNEYFRQIVQMGPRALPAIQKMIMESNQNGLREYLLAIAAESILKVDLKGDSYQWSSGKKWVPVWIKHIRNLSDNITKIADSQMSPKEKNDALIKLGTPVLPFILDEMGRGNHQYTMAFMALTKGSGSTPDLTNGEDAANWAKTHADDIQALREITQASR